MSVYYATTVKTTQLNDVITAIDAGASSGWLRLLVGASVISSLQLAKPSGVVVGRTLTFSGMPLVDPAASASGTPNAARIEDSDGNVIISSLTVGGIPGYDIVLTSSNVPPYSIVAGQTVAITVATITGN